MPANATHCLPNGYLGTKELPVCNVSGGSIATFNPPAGVGQRRGVVVFFSGLYIAPVAVCAPPVLADAFSGLGSTYAASLANNLATDGWIVLAVPAQEDSFSGVPTGGIYTDMQNDTGYGARYLASTLHVWDHVYQYIQQTYGSVPIIVCGTSLGGWRTLQVAANRTSQIVGYFAHDPVTIWETVWNAYTPGYTFGTLNFSGADIGPTFLAGVTVPGMVGYGTIDNAVYWGGNSTLATVNGSTTPVAIGSVTALTVAGGSVNFLNSANGFITVTGLTGGTSQGRATLKYTAYSAGAFTGVTLVGGSGTLPVGAGVLQSNTDSILLNNTTITRMSTGQPHSLGVTDSGAYYAGTATTIASINTATTLQITGGTNGQAAAAAIPAQYLISGACAIQDTAGVWHPFTFGGTSSPNLTTVVVSGSGSIAAGAPICNTGSVISGGFSNMSYPYWVNTVLDPKYPRNF